MTEFHQGAALSRAPWCQGQVHQGAEGEDPGLGSGTEGESPWFPLWGAGSNQNMGLVALSHKALTRAEKGVSHGSLCLGPTLHRQQEKPSAPDFVRRTTHHFPCCSALADWTGFPWELTPSHHCGICVCPCTVTTQVSARPGCAGVKMGPDNTSACVTSQV